MAEDSDNALGLDFSEAKPEPQPVENEQTSPVSAKIKPSPYINPERVKTGGNQRETISEEALEERIARIRLQNEKIKQRRLDVQADEAAWNKTQEAELARKAEARKVQQDINNARSRNAQRKMDRAGNRKWDSEKLNDYDGMPIVSTAWDLDGTMTKSKATQQGEPQTSGNDWANDGDGATEGEEWAGATATSVGNDWAKFSDTNAKPAEEEWGGGATADTAAGSKDSANLTGAEANSAKEEWGGPPATTSGNDWANSPGSKPKTAEEEWGTPAPAANDGNQGWGPPPAVSEWEKVATEYPPPGQASDSGSTRGRGRGGRGARGGERGGRGGERGGRGRGRGDRGGERVARGRGARGRGGDDWAASSDTTNPKLAEDEWSRAAATTTSSNDWATSPSSKAKPDVEEWGAAAPATKTSSNDWATANVANTSSNDWAYSPSSKPKPAEEEWGAPATSTAETDENGGWGPPPDQSANEWAKVAEEYTQPGSLPAPDGQSTSVRGRGRGRGERGRGRGGDRGSRGRGRGGDGDRIGGSADLNDWSRGGGGRGRARGRGRGEAQEPRDIPQW